MIMEQKRAGRSERDGEALIFAEAFFGNTIVLRVMIVLAKRYETQDIVVVDDGQLVAMFSIGMARGNFVILDGDGINMSRAGTGRVTLGHFGTQINRRAEIRCYDCDYANNYDKSCDDTIGWFFHVLLFFVGVYCGNSVALAFSRKGISIAFVSPGA